MRIILYHQGSFVQRPHFKVFENEAEYEAFIGGTKQWLRPNVDYSVFKEESLIRISHQPSILKKDLNGNVIEETVEPIVDQDADNPVDNTQGDPAKDTNINAPEIQDNPINVDNNVDNGVQETNEGFQRVAHGEVGA